MADDAHSIPTPGEQVLAHRAERAAAGHGVPNYLSLHDPTQLQLATWRGVY